MDPTDEHIQLVADRIASGVLIPFLGAGVHLAGDENLSFERAERPPSGRELAKHLAGKTKYPEADKTDLLRVAQFMQVVLGDGALYGELRDVFDVDYPPTRIHRFLAGLPAVMRAESRARPELGMSLPLIITTNYDDALEMAFAEAGEEIDVLTYIARGNDTGKLLHRDPTGVESIVRQPNKYDRASLRERPVVLKIHGTVDKADKTGDSFVISEDHYIDYLTRTEVKKLVPANIAESLYTSHFLFLGYSLSDWNLRVILYRIWGQRELEYVSWAILRDPSQVDTELWLKRGVKIIDSDVGSYVDRLRQALDDRPSS